MEPSVNFSLMVDFGELPLQAAIYSFLHSVPHLTVFSAQNFELWGISDLFNHEEAHVSSSLHHSMWYQHGEILLIT